MALGFLFMGAGTLTFGTSPEAVAALVISLFPRMPASTTDHRCHLQVGGRAGWDAGAPSSPAAQQRGPRWHRSSADSFACATSPQVFRHLYVLAAQPRSVDAIDVDTKQAVYVPLQIELASPSPAPGAARFDSVLRPVASVSKGAGDVLADLAAQAAAAAGSQQPAFLFDTEGDAGAGSASKRGGGGVTFDRIAPCLLPEQKQVQCRGVAVGLASFAAVLPASRTQDNQAPPPRLPRSPACRSPLCA